LHPSIQTGVAHGVLESQSVHYRRQHAHVVRSRAIHSCSARRNTAEDISAADDYSQFNVQRSNVGNFSNDSFDRLTIYSKGVFPH